MFSLHAFIFVTVTQSVLCNVTSGYGWLYFKLIIWFSAMFVNGK